MHDASPSPMGHYEIVHRIVRGDSISGIAAWYHRQGWPVSDWQPIWRHNTAVYGNLRDRRSPDRIYTGDVLIIPRSPTGYDALIAKLGQLLVECVTNRTAQDHLAAVRKDADAFGARIDLVGTVATLGAGLTLKGAKLVQLAREARTLSGTGLAANRYLARRAAEEMAKDVRKFVSEKTLEHASEPLGTAYKGYGSVDKLRGIRTTVRLGTILDAAEIILDWLAPSYFAKIAVGFEKTMEEEQEKADRAKASTLSLLTAKIAAVGREKAVVYRT
jgi:hypothetical protein